MDSKQISFIKSQINKVQDDDLVLEHWNDFSFNLYFPYFISQKVFECIFDLSSYLSENNIYYYVSCKNDVCYFHFYVPND